MTQINMIEDECCLSAAVSLIQGAVIGVSIQTPTKKVEGSHVMLENGTSSQEQGWGANSSYGAAC